MLVLTRKRNESLLIGEDVVITILRIANDKVRIGIRAPKDVPVWRPEALGKKNIPGDEEDTKERD